MVLRILSTSLVYNVLFYEAIKQINNNCYWIILNPKPKCDYSYARFFIWFHAIEQFSFNSTLTGKEK